MKNRSSILLYIFCLLILTTLLIVRVNHAHASDNEILIDKMVEKGYLSPIEATIIKEETEEFLKKQISQGRYKGLPKWVQNTKLKGGLRLRYQYEHRKSFKSRSRGRLRYRLGLETRITRNIKVGAGLASGGSDPRSTNQSFEDSFSSGDIRLDYAFAEFKPWPWLSFIGGKWKRKDYLWTPTDLLWDKDINPEGGAVHIEFNPTNFANVFLNVGALVLDEIATRKSDPYVAYVQPGFYFNLDDKIDVKATGIYYAFNAIRGKQLDNSSCTNSGLSLVGNSCIGTLDFDYDSIGGSLEIGYNFLRHEQWKRIALFGDWITNTQVSTEVEDIGYAAGIRFGDKSIKDFGHWQLAYQFSYLERDAFPDIFPNSDRYDGETNVVGHKASLKLGLAPYVTLGVNYYRDKKLEGPELPQNLIQADVEFKF